MTMLFFRGKKTTLQPGDTAKTEYIALGTGKVFLLREGIPMENGTEKNRKDFMGICTTGENADFLALFLAAQCSGLDLERRGSKEGLYYEFIKAEN